MCRFRFARPVSEKLIIYRLAIYQFDERVQDGSKAVGFFKLANDPAKLSATWNDLGLTGRQHVRDLWRQKHIGTFDLRFETTVPRHGVTFVRFSD
jgi:alpha-galactosidase